MSSPFSPNPWWQRLIRAICQPKTLAWTVGGIGAIALGYGVALSYLKTHLPPWLEKEAARLTHRKVILGPVEYFTLTHIRFGRSRILPNARYPNQLDAKTVDLEINYLPLLLQRTLPLTITLDGAQASLKQDVLGRWIHVVLAQVSLPIQFDLTFIVKQGRANFLPYGFKQPIDVKLNGQAHYQEVGDKHWRYDVDVVRANSRVKIQGKSEIASGLNQIAIATQSFHLADWDSLLQNTPFSFEQGTVLADTRWQFKPDEERKIRPQANGNLSLQGGQAHLAAVNVPLIAQADLNFEGNVVRFNRAKLGYGDIIADLDGLYDWRSGFNLQGRIGSFKLSSLRSLIPSLPVSAANNRMGLAFTLKGLVSNPRLMGSFYNKNPIFINKTAIKTVSGQFDLTLQQFKLHQLQLSPAAGGELIAHGTILPLLQKSEQGKTQTDWNRSKVEANFSAQLPFDDLIKPYLAVHLQIPLINSRGTLQGDLRNPEGDLQWSSPKTSTKTSTKAAAIAARKAPVSTTSGSAQLRNGRLRIQDGTLISALGEVVVQGQANLRDRLWQSQFDLRSLAVNPFFAKSDSGLSQFPPTKLAGTFRINGQGFTFGPRTLQGDAALNLYLNQEKIHLQSQFNRGQGQANISFNALSLGSKLGSTNLPLSLNNGELKIQGNFDRPQKRSRFDWTQVMAQGKVDLQLAQRSLQIYSTLNEGKLQGNAQSALIGLNPLLPKSSPVLNLIDTQLQFQQQLPSDLRLINPAFLAQQMAIQAQGQLAIGLNVFDVRSQLQHGNFAFFANNRQSLTGSPVQSSVKIDRAQVQLTGYLPDLLTAGQAPQFDRLRGHANLQLATNLGQIAVQSQLQQRQWQAQITSDPFTLPQVESQGRLRASLSGSLQSLPQQDAWLIRSDRIQLAFGQQALTASGDLQFSNPGGQIFLDRLDFAIAAQGNFGLLNFDRLFDRLFLNSAWRPQTPRLAGIGRFEGNLKATAMPLLSLTPRDLQIRGKVNLANFAVNDLAFERSLEGSLSFNSHQAFELTLWGKQDTIALNWPFSTTNTTYTYALPYSFEITQAALNPQPFTLRGESQGDRLVMTADRFPLSLIKLSPLSSWDITTSLDGILSASFAVNRQNLRTQGEFVVKRPQLGSVIATSFSGKVAYSNPHLSLQDSILILANSRYQLQGDLNLKSQAVSAKLRLDRAEIADLIALLRLQDLDRLQRIAQGKIPRSRAKSLAGEAIADQDKAIAQRLQRLWQIDQKIRQRARQQRQGQLPNQLDFRGTLTGAIDLAGTLKNPEVSWQLAGDRWQWIPQAPFLNLIEPLGLVIEASRPLYLGKGVFTGQWSQGQWRFTPHWRLGSAEIRGDGQLTYRDRQWQWVDSTLEISNLNLDLFRSFVKLPVDISGNITLASKFTGKWNDPSIIGNFAFVDAALNGLLFKEALEGQFQYDRDRLTLSTLSAQSLQIHLDLPIPLPKSKPAPFRIFAQVDTTTVPLIEQLTQNRLTWRGGEGKVNLDVSGNLALGNQLQVNFDPLSQMVVTLTGAELGGTLLPMPIKLDGAVVVKNQLIQPQNLVVRLGNSQLLATGTLPLVPRDRAVTDPLTVTLQKPATPQPQSLYSGDLSGQIILTGSALMPLISGNLLFDGGNIRLPPPAPPVASSLASRVASRWFGDRRLTGNLFQPPQLQNFHIGMNNLEISAHAGQRLNYDFNLTGDVFLKGTLGDIRQIEPQGTVYVTRGKIDIPAVPLFLSRQYANRVVFLPQNGLFDPYLDLKFKLYLFSVSLQTINANEVLDDISRSGRATSTEVTVNILGRAEQLVPSLTGNLTAVCQSPSPDQPVIPENPQLSPLLFSKLASCLRFGMIKDATFQELLRSPIVTFDSSPPLRENELQALLGNPSPLAIDQLQQQTSAQLKEAGVPQVAVVVFPFLQDWVFELNEGATEWGKNIGLSTLRLYPTVETIVPLDNRSLLRFSYDYNVGEGTIRWESKF